MTSADARWGSEASGTVSGDAAESTAEDLATIEAEDVDEQPNGALVEDLRAEAAANLDKYQRAVADMANYRRRKEQESLRIGAQTRRAVMHSFLPVVDDFERALEAVDGDVQSDWIEGFRLIERKLWSILESEGVRPMESIGEPFDPSLHEAVEVDPEAQSADTVVGEYRRGYFIGDDVLRPAMVKVGSSMSADEDSE